MLSVAWLQSWSRRSVRLPEFSIQGFPTDCTGLLLGVAVLAGRVGETLPAGGHPRSRYSARPQPLSYTVVTTSAGATRPAWPMFSMLPATPC